MPQDHVFDPEVWARPLPLAEAGPDIEFREYSLLDNPRMPKARIDRRTRFAHDTNGCWLPLRRACSSRGYWSTFVRTGNPAQVVQVQRRS